MEEFRHMNHILEYEYMEVDTKLELGNGWSFTSESDSPLKRIFKLSFQGYKFYTKEEDSVEVIDPDASQYVNNMADLIAFYAAHRTFKRFIFKPYGLSEEVTVRFKEPLKVPKGLPNGGGALEPFTITLEEMV